MLNKPQDAVGKWYSNLLGNPNHFQFILKARKFGEVFLIDFINMRRVGMLIHKREKVRSTFLQEPTKGEMYLSSLNKRLVKSIFRNLGK